MHGENLKLSVQYLSVSHNIEHFSLPLDVFLVCDFVKFDGRLPV